MSSTSAEQTRIIDRIAVGLLSGVAAFLTAAFIWLVVFYTLETTGTDYQPSFVPVLIFSAVMFILGFATLSNLVANLLAKIWNILYRGLRFWE